MFKNIQDKKLSSKLQAKNRWEFFELFIELIDGKQKESKQKDT